MEAGTELIKKSKASDENISFLEKRKAVAFFVGILFSFSSFKSVLSLLSTIHVENALGALAGTVIYITAILWSTLLTPTLLKIIGAKYGLILSEIFYGIFVIGNMYPVTWAMIIASICGGIAEGVIWPSISILCVQLAHEYSKISKKSQAELESKMFGHFYQVVFGTTLIGNLLSYIVLTNQRSYHKEAANTSSINVENYNAQCGVEDCQQASVIEDNMNHYVPADKIIVYILLSVFASMGLLGAITHFKFLQNLESNVEKKKNKQESWASDILNTFKRTVHQIVNPIQLLLVPINPYAGLKLGFVVSEFARAYVACFIGVAKVGLFIATFGIAGFVSSMLIKHISTPRRRNAALFACAIADIGLCLFLMYGDFNEMEIWKFYIAVIVQGLTLSPFLSLTNTQCTDYFPPHKHEAAFSIWNATYMAGIMIVFALSPHACIRTKLLALVGFNIFSFLIYVAAEVINYKIKRKTFSREKTDHDDERLSNPSNTSNNS